MKIKRLNLWFEGLMKKRCPECKKDTKGTVIGWYEYIRAKKNLVMHFCENCFVPRVPNALAYCENSFPDVKLVWSVNHRYCPRYVEILEGWNDNWDNSRCIEVACEIADEVLRDNHKDIIINVEDEDGTHYTEEAQKYFDRYYDHYRDWIAQITGVEQDG